MNGYRSPTHREAFKKAIESIDKNNHAALAALYLLTADRLFWKQARRFVNASQIAFEQMKVPSSNSDAYTLFSAAQDFYSGTSNMTIAMLVDEDVTRSRIFYLICYALMIRRFGVEDSLFFEEAVQSEAMEVPVNA